MVTTFPYQQVYNLLSLPEGTCLPSMKFVPLSMPSYQGKFLKTGSPKNMPRCLPGFVPSDSGENAPLMPISSPAESELFTP